MQDKPSCEKGQEFDIFIGSCYAMTPKEAEQMEKDGFIPSAISQTVMEAYWDDFGSLACHMFLEWDAEGNFLGSRLFCRPSKEYYKRVYTSIFELPVLQDFVPPATLVIELGEE